MSNNILQNLAFCILAVLFAVPAHGKYTRPSDLPSFNLGKDARNPFAREAVQVINEVNSKDNEATNILLREYLSDGATRRDASNIQTVLFPDGDFAGLIAIQGATFEPGDIIEFPDHFSTRRPIENTQVKLVKIGGQSLVVEVQRGFNKKVGKNSVQSGETYTLSIALPEFFRAKAPIEDEFADVDPARAAELLSEEGPELQSN